MDYPFIREIRSPLTSEQLRPLDERCRVVQFSRPLADDEYARLAEFIRPYPQVKLRIYGPYGVQADLEFLRHFPFVRRFQCDVYKLTSLDGLRHLPDSLEFLGLGQTKSKRYSLSILSRFPELRTLCLEGFTRDIHVIGTLRKLQDLTLRSITLPDLEILTNLPGLRSLDLKLGGTKNLDALPRIEHLRYLELWMIKGLADLSVLSRLTRLQFLFLQALKNVTSLPSLRSLPCLRRVHIETMKG